MPITIAIADDQPVLRMGLAQLLEAQSDCKVLFQASDGKDFVEQLLSASIKPDICILDLSMPVLDGFETLSAIRKKFPEMKILVYSMYLEEFNVLRIYKAGANAAFSKEHPFDELVEALMQVHSEGLYIPTDIRKPVAEAISKRKIILPKLSSREVEYYKLYCKDLSYKEIADKMGVTVRTATTYHDNISKKLGIRSRSGLLLFAIKTGIVGWNI